VTLPPQRPARLPDIEVLDLFVSVVELGSISKAAAVHHLSQPAASERLRRLERRLGVHLLERTTTGSAATPAGSLVAAWARQVLDASAGLLAAVATLTRSSGGRLRLAASLTIAEYLLPRWLAALRAHRPDLAIELQVANSSRVAERLLAGEAALGFVEGPETVAGLSARTVATDELAVVVAPTHPWARARQVTAAELAGTPLVVREPGSGTRETLDRALAPHRRPGRPCEPVAELGSTTAVLSLVAGGVAPGVVSRLALPGGWKGLVTVQVGGLDLTRRLRAVWRCGQEPEGPVVNLLAIARRATGWASPDRPSGTTPIGATGTGSSDDLGLAHEPRHALAVDQHAASAEFGRDPGDP
jgi:DNA-binding transcriptional LysR family regulator